MQIEFKRSEVFNDPTIYCSDENGFYYDLDQWAFYRWLTRKGIIAYCMATDIDDYFSNAVTGIEEDMAEYIIEENIQPVNNIQTQNQ